MLPGTSPALFLQDESLRPQILLVLCFQPLPSPSEPGAGTGVAVMEGEVKQQSFVEVGILVFFKFPSN